MRSVLLNGDGLQLVIDAAVPVAQAAANVTTPVVFCPIPATFKDGSNAREDNLAQGLVLCVDCDQRPQQARNKLEAILGPPTLVVESGGVWIDPATGEIQSRVHLYWRLKRPATGEDLAKLKRARRLATQYVGGDPTNISMCAPAPVAGLLEPEGRAPDGPDRCGERARDRPRRRPEQAPSRPA